MKPIKKKRGEKATKHTLFCDKDKFIKPFSLASSSNYNNSQIYRGKMAEEGCCDNGETTFNDGTHCISKTVDTGGIDSKRFYLARTTAFEMLRDRGYEVNEAELSLSLSEFRSVFGEKPDLERLRICVPLRSDPKIKVSAFIFSPLVFNYFWFETDENLQKASTFFDFGFVFGFNSFKERKMCKRFKLFSILGLQLEFASTFFDLGFNFGLGFDFKEMKFWKRFQLFGSMALLND